MADDIIAPSATEPALHVETINGLAEALQKVIKTEMRDSASLPPSGFTDPARNALASAAVTYAHQGSPPVHLSAEDVRTDFSSEIAKVSTSFSS